MGRLAAALLAAAVATAGVSASARMHAPYRGHRIIPANAGVLDGFTAPQLAYSLRRLRTAYSGFGVRLQRVDTTTQDIGFTAAGDLDIAAAAAFCTTACTVNFWYDQSGNSRNVFQATAASQPEFVFNCIGALPCIRETVTAQQLTASASVSSTGVSSFSAVANRVAGPTVQCTWLRQNGVSGNRISTHTIANNWVIHNNTTAVAQAASDGAWHTATGVMNGAGTYLNIDGAGATGSLTAVGTSGQPSSLGGAAAATCLITEAIAWNGYALTAPETAALTANQRNYWLPQVVGIANPAAAYSFRKIVSIYNGPAVKLRRTTGGTQDIGFAGNDFDSVAAATFCASTSCFIDTWYDQSGLGRHATQATTANQPAYIADCGTGKPCARATTATQNLLTSFSAWAANKTTLSTVARRTAGTAARCYPINKGNSYFGPTAAADSWVMTDFVAEFTMFTGVTEGAWHTGMAVYDGAASLMRMDGVEQAAGTIAGGGAGAVAGILNAGSAGTTCETSEGIIWDNYALTPAERTALAQNQRDYWMPLPLDTFATPAAAYSMRKLKSTYAGPAIHIRRASDNAETDINFLSFTGFTGAPIDVAQANAFCAATNCFIVFWHDQSGNARHLWQGTPANQPMLFFNCLASLPCARWDDPRQMFFSGAPAPVSPVSLNAVAHNTVRGSAGCSYLAASGNTLLQHAGADTVFLYNGSASIASGAPIATWHSFTGVMNGASSVMRVDATAEVTGTVTVTTPGGGLLGFVGGAATTCDSVEKIYWSGYALTAGERAALQANQASFWGTP